MSDDTAGRATIREVRDLLQALDDKMDSRFERLTRDLDEKYVLRAACRERPHIPIDQLIAATDERYASKLTQRIVYSAMALIGVSVFGALIALVV